MTLTEQRIQKTVGSTHQYLGQNDLGKHKWRVLHPTKGWKIHSTNSYDMKEKL